MKGEKLMKLLTLFASGLFGVILFGSIILIVGLIDLYIRTNYPKERKRSIIYLFNDFPLVTGVYGFTVVVAQVMLFF